MRIALLAWRTLWARPLSAALNLVLLSLGLAAITFLTLTSTQLERAVERDLAGIDLVVGAKGSPLQLILAGVYHLDSPTGNIPFSALQTLREHPLVDRVVPISLGDSLKGHRIVGTSHDYLQLYRATVATGRLWTAPMEAVLGADVARQMGLKAGDQFHGSHGLGQVGIDAHEHHPFEVVGVMNRTGTVIDRLVLTDTASVWDLHATHPPAVANTAANNATAEAQRELTMLLVTYRSPLAAASLPRWVNAQAALQSASTALETARLLRIVSAGTEVLKGFGIVLLLAAGLSVFIALYHAVREREGDLAMMRMLGAPPRRVAWLVLAEALWLALLGTVIGLALGHALTEVFGWALRADRSLDLSGARFTPWELLVPALALALAVVGAALPAWRAYRLDVTRLLQTP